MSVINTNVKSLISQNAMIKNNRELGTAMQQLSTGKRINSAKDDAAGLAISSRMTAQIRGLDQAVRNGNDAISMLQTTEGAMIEMTNMLQRMHELAVQSANDTYTQDDRSYLNLEFQQLKTEINRITRDTQWNGMDVLNGTFTNDSGQVGRFRFQMGGSEGQVITHDILPMGFVESTGTATISVAGNAAATPAIPAKSLTLAGDYTAGDKISVFLKGDSSVTPPVADITSTYTVTGNDLLSGDHATNLAAIAAHAAAKFGADSGQTVTQGTGASSGVLTFGTMRATSTSSISYVNKDGLLTNIKALDITTNTSANNSLSELSTAIDTISKERAKIGAVINRLTYANDNLTNVSQNTTESRSRILDTDYAKASAELARTQIISQAATAMLAQANQVPQTVLKLLQG